MTHRLVPLVASNLSLSVCCSMCYHTHAQTAFITFVLWQVLLNFPRRLDRTTVDHKQLHYSVSQLVAHARQHQCAQHSQQGQPQGADILQWASEVGTPKIGSTADIATKSPQCHGVQKQEQLRLDEVPIIVSVLMRITQSPAGAALAQQLASQAYAEPMQRCIQLLGWAYQVYAHIPRSQLKVRDQLCCPLHRTC